MEPLTFFQIKVFNAQLAVRCKSATQLNTRTYFEKTRCQWHTIEHTCQMPNGAGPHEVK
jgi:hypothetical protein